jgi:hypothetical protein
MVTASRRPWHDARWQVMLAGLCFGTSTITRHSCLAEASHQQALAELGPTIPSAWPIERQVGLNPQHEARVRRRKHRRAGSTISWTCFLDATLKRDDACQACAPP